jgi:hypothetical protein
MHQNPKPTYPSFFDITRIGRFDGLDCRSHGLEFSTPLTAVEKFRRTDCGYIQTA